MPAEFTPKRLAATVFAVFDLIVLVYTLTNSSIFTKPGIQAMLSLSLFLGLVIFSMAALGYERS